MSETGLHRNRLILVVSGHKIFVKTCERGKVMSFFNFFKFDKKEEAEEEYVVRGLGTTTLYALVAQAENTGKNRFTQTVTVPGSFEELAEKVRAQFGCNDAAVVFVSPRVWNPPGISSVDENELAAKFPYIVNQAASYLNSKEVYKSRIELINHGVVIPNYASGRILFVYKT